jgi:hypothetical protein
MIMRTEIKLYITTAVILLMGFSLHAQEATEEKEPIEPVMELMYLKDTDGKIHLRSTMVDYINRMPVPLPGLKVVFQAGDDPVEYLGELITDADGIAELILEENPEWPGYADGEIRFYAEYEGSEDIMFADAEVYVTPVTLEMELEMIDSVGYVSLRAFTTMEGEKVPVADEDVYVYVKRMFSDMPIGEDFLDENGEYEVEVPDDIPGNAEGDIEIIGRFNDHYMFGTVEQRETIRWGIPTEHKLPGGQRTLWTQIAPLWMIITLSIMLLGVWGHYTYVIISLFRIRSESRKQKAAGTA